MRFTFRRGRVRRSVRRHTPLCSVSGRPRPRAAQRRPLRAAGAGRPVAQNVPYGAAGSAEDVARAALFLADPNLAFVTGTELAVDVE